MKPFLIKTTIWKHIVQFFRFCDFWVALWPLFGLKKKKKHIYKICFSCNRKAIILIEGMKIVKPSKVTNSGLATLACFC